MLERLRRQARAHLESWFPERQIYHQAKGELRFLRITTTQQTLAAATALGVSIWLVIATMGASVTALVLGQGAAQIAKIEDRYEAGLAAVKAREARQADAMADKAASLSQDLAEIERRQRALEAMVQAAAPRQAAPAPAAAGAVTAPANQQLSPEQVRAKAEAMKRQQEAFLRAAEQTAAQRALAARTQLAAMGVARGPVQAGQGGPFISLRRHQESRASDGGFQTLVARVGAQLRETAALEGMVSAAPVGAPIGEAFSMTSDYGPRRDPVNGGAAWHGGVDLVASYGAPVLAAADGVVTFVGWQSGYGNVVEIDHGHGFSSLYGHMTTGFRVSVGQKVTRGAVLGGLGNSGRSTGPHLHFEVLLDGQTLDPERFMTAGGNVWTEE
jgi:murein DD-endopeptidase MepM/ murein hydrolase activator NlpD